MDLIELCALPRIPRRGRCGGRIQRQVHVQSIRAARRFVRDSGVTYPHDLSEFLSTRSTLAIFRDSARTRHVTVRVIYAAQ